MIRKLLPVLSLIALFATPALASAMQVVTDLHHRGREHRFVRGGRGLQDLERHDARALGCSGVVRIFREMPRITVLPCCQPGSCGEYRKFGQRGSPLCHGRQELGDRPEVLFTAQEVGVAAKLLEQRQRIERLERKAGL